LSLTSQKVARRQTIILADTVLIVVESDFRIVLISLVATGIFHQVMTQITIYTFVAAAVVAIAIATILVAARVLLRLFFLRAGSGSIATASLYARLNECFVHFLLLLEGFLPLFGDQKFYFFLMEAEIEQIDFLDLNVKVAEPLVHIAHVFLLDVFELIGIEVDVAVEHRHFELPVVYLELSVYDREGAPANHNVLRYVLF